LLNDTQISCILYVCGNLIMLFLFEMHVCYSQIRLLTFLLLIRYHLNALCCMYFLIYLSILTNREMGFKVSLNQTKFGFKLHFSDWFGTKFKYVLSQIHRKCVITIQIWFNVSLSSGSCVIDCYFCVYNVDI